MRRIMLTLVMLCLPMAVSAAIINVPADQPTIQAGIDAAAPGDTVIVADGVWTGEGNRDIDLDGKAITVRSANGPGSCTIDCQGSEADQHRAFVFHQDETRDTVIQGFTIRNGYHVDFDGGAIHCGESSPTIAGNIFLENYSREGSAIYIGGGTALITNNRFEGQLTYLYGSSICLAYSDATIDGNTIVNNGTLAIMCRSRHGYLFEPLIVDNLISGNAGGIICENSSPLIEGNTITSNGRATYSNAGGIKAYNMSTPTIRDNLISSNSSEDGAGIWIGDGIVIGNRIIDNVAWETGGGLALHLSGAATGAVVRDNVISGNRALGTLPAYGGGGIMIYGGEVLLIENNLITDNHAFQGGGIMIRVYDSDIRIRGNTIAGNVADEQGGAIHIFEADMLEIRDCILYGNSPDEITMYEPVDANITYSDIQGGHSGTGNISADPHFATGPEGDFYLSQTAAGQPVQSPCVNAGDPAYNPPAGTTRTDEVTDSGRTDMGYHHPSEPPDTIIVRGPSGTVSCPVLTFTFTGEDDMDPPEALQFSNRLDSGSWSAWSAATQATYSGLADGEHLFQVRARDSAGNVDPTPAESMFIVEPWQAPAGLAGLVVGPGPAEGNPPLVRTSSAQWLAYGAMRYGVNVACGNLDGSGLDEVLTGPGPGPQFGPQVRGWTPDGVSLPGVNFFAYGTLKYGVNVAAGDIDGDGKDEIITGAGPGAVFGPHVRGWNVDGGTAAPIPGVSYFAYGTLKYGVNVATGDIDGDGIDEIITGAGPGAVFGPHVRGWKHDGGSGTTSIPAVSYFAYGTLKYGVNVGCGDVDGDGVDEIITGAGPGSIFGAHVRAWDFSQGSTVSQVPGASWFAYSSTLYGARVCAGDIDADGIDEIITVPGPDPAAPAHVRAWNADGGAVTSVSSVSFLAFDPWMTYGGSVAAGRF